MPTIRQLRGDYTDSVHPFSAVWSGPRGVRLWGEPFRTPFRSAAKPVQLRASLKALGDPELPSEVLAVGTASHAGQPEHVALVEQVMGYFRLEQSCLLCGAHAPLHVPSHHALILSGRSPSVLHNNCSGKHAFMAAASRAQGWDADYRDPNHPLQLDIRARLTLGGSRPEFATDGCGVPSWVMSLEEMARVWQGVVLDPDPVMRGIRQAMEKHPHLTSGTDRLDEDIMAGAKESMFVKIGAQALFCMGFPERRGALVVKVHTGVGAALGLAVKASLQRLVQGAWQEPPGWNHEQLRNVVGKLVGRRVVEES